ncbi:MAG: methyl-accepting chemotaxis protein, partial [Comamonadaceae bacterium]
MNSIADKFKKMLPAKGESSDVQPEGAALVIDHADTVQPPEERTLYIPRADKADAGDAADGKPSAYDAPVDFAPSRNFDEPVAPLPADAMPADSMAAVPVAESRSSGLARRQRLLALALAAAVLLLLLVAGAAILRADRVAQQVASTGQSLMQSQRLAKSVSQALVGSEAAFTEVKDSSDDLLRRVNGLASGDEGLKLEAVGSDLATELAKSQPLAER